MRVASQPSFTDPAPSSGLIFPTASHRIRVSSEVLSDGNAFDAMRGEWDELLDQSGQCVFFLRWKWNALWWRHYAPAGAKLHLITCRSADGTLIGLAPFYWRQHRLCGIAYARELLFVGMGVDRKTSEHLDIIARRGYERVVSEAVASSLLNDTSWDRLWLSQVPRESLILPHLVRALGGTVRTEVCDYAPYIDTSTDWETFKAGFGRSMRRNVEYYPRRLFRSHPASELRRVTRADEVEHAMDALVRLHQTRWQAQGEPGAFDPLFASFLREIARDACVNGRLALWTLTIDGQIEAALLGFVDNGILHYFQKGFNPAFAKEDLGTAMLALCVRECFFSPGIHAFDFMGGGAPYKSLWTRASRQNVVCEVQRATPGAALFTALAHGWGIVRRIYHRVVPQWLRVARRERLRKLRLRSVSNNAAHLVLWCLTDGANSTTDYFGSVVKCL